MNHNSGGIISLCQSSIATFNCVCGLLSSNMSALIFVKIGINPANYSGLMSANCHDPMHAHNNVQAQSHNMTA